MRKRTSCLVRKPVRPGSHSKNMTKVAEINKLIKREDERHARKSANLHAQMSAARQMTNDGRQRVTLARITGDHEEERVRHQQKIADLTERRQNVTSK